MDKKIEEKPETKPAERMSPVWEMFTSDVTWPVVMEPDDGSENK